MSWQLLRLGEVAPAPWHNGGGLTRELLAWPRAGQWTVRLSVADVTQDGPFSRLPGVRRWFAVLSGEGVRLRTGDLVHELGRQTQPIEFDGAAATDCELLLGTTRDFNLMLRQGCARMQRVNGAWTARCGAGSMVAVYANAAPATIYWADEAPLALPMNALAWRILDCDGLTRVAGADALWMEVET